MLGEVAQGRVAPHVTALVRPLQLDEEALRAEGVREPGGGVRVLHREAVAGAAGEADEAVGVLLDEALGHGGSERLTILAARLPGARVRLGQDPAQVRVAPARLDEQRHVRAGSPLGSVEPTPLSVTSAPVIGRTPRSFAAWANSSEP